MLEDMQDRGGEGKRAWQPSRALVGLLRRTQGSRPRLARPLCTLARSSPRQVRPLRGGLLGFGTPGRAGERQAGGMRTRVAFTSTAKHRIIARCDGLTGQPPAGEIFHGTARLCRTFPRIVRHAPGCLRRAFRSG